MPEVIGTLSGVCSGNYRNPITWEHTVPTRFNRVLVVSVVTWESITVSAVTYGGVALTRAARYDDDAGSVDYGVELWYLVAPTPGTATVSVAYSGGASGGYNVCAATTIAPVNQTTPLGEVDGFARVASTTGGLSISMTTANENSLFFAALGYNQYFVEELEPLADNTLLYKDASGFGGALIYRSESGAGTYSVGALFSPDPETVTSQVLVCVEFLHDETNASVDVTDSGTGDDDAWHPDHYVTDTGTGTDAVVRQVSPALTEGLTGDDTVDVVIATQVAETDDGAGLDEVAVVAIIDETDTGAGSDDVGVEVHIAVADTGTSLDGVRPLRGDPATLRQHPHKARLYLAVKQPRIVWKGRVAADRGANEEGDKEADLTINITSGANVSGYDVADFMPDLTAFVGTTDGAYDHGKCRVRAFDGTNLTVGADMSCVWKAGDYVSITDLHELWLRPHRSVVDEDADTLTFYKDTDLEATTRAEYPVPVMGCDAAAFRDPKTGLATVRFDGSLSYKVQPNSSSYDKLKWDNKGIAAYAWWFEGGTPEYSTDAAVTVTYDSPHPHGVTVRLVVTDRDGLTCRGFRNVFIFDRTGTNAPITAFTLNRLGGSLANHGWEADLDLFGDTLSLTTLPEDAKCILFSEEWFGDTAGAVPMGHAAITRRENIKMQGWLQDAKVVQDQSGVVSASATLRGLQRYLERQQSFEVYFTQVDDAAPAWSYFSTTVVDGVSDGLTVRKALYHLINWHYTLIGMADVLLPDDHNNYLAGHTFPGGHLGTQLDSFVKRIQAQWVTDKTGALHVFSWPNWLPVMGAGSIWRDVLYQDVTFTTADFEKVSITPRMKDHLAAVRVEGTIATGSGYNAWSVDIAPGNSKGFKGSQLTVGQQILGTGGAVGTQGYELAMLRYVEESRREESVTFTMAGNYSCFDIIPSTGFFRATLAPTKFRGYAWNAKPFWVTGMDLDVDVENGTIGTTIDAIPETKPAGDLDIWSQTGEVGFDGQEDPIATSGAFSDMLEALGTPKAEWVPALMGDGTSHVEGAESGTSIVRLWGDPSRAVLADNRLFKNVQDRPVVVEVVYNDSGAGKAGAPTYRVVGVDAAKDSDADSDEDRGYITRQGVLGISGSLSVGKTASMVLHVMGSQIKAVAWKANLRTAPTTGATSIALTRNGSTIVTATFAVGVLDTAGTVSQTLEDGDVLDLLVTAAGGGAGLTFTLQCREYGL